MTCHQTQHSMSKLFLMSGHVWMFCGTAWLLIGLLLSDLGVELPGVFVVTSLCFAVGGAQWWLGGETNTKREENERQK